MREYVYMQRFLSTLILINMMFLLFLAARLICIPVSSIQVSYEQVRS